MFVECSSRWLAGSELHCVCVSCQRRFFSRGYLHVAAFNRIYFSSFAAFNGGRNVVGTVASLLKLLASGSHMPTKVYVARNKAVVWSLFSGCASERNIKREINRGSIWSMTGCYKLFSRQSCCWSVVPGKQRCWKPVLSEHSAGFKTCKLNRVTKFQKFTCERATNGWSRFQTVGCSGQRLLGSTRIFSSVLSCKPC